MAMGGSLGFKEFGTTPHRHDVEGVVQNIQKRPRFDVFRLASCVLCWVGFAIALWTVQLGERFVMTMGGRLEKQCWAVQPIGSFLGDTFLAAWAAQPMRSIWGTHCLGGATYRRAFAGHCFSGLGGGATYKLAIGVHIFSSLGGET